MRCENYITRLQLLWTTLSMSLSEQNRNLHFGRSQCRKCLLLLITRKECISTTLPLMIAFLFHVCLWVSAREGENHPRLHVHMWNIIIISILPITHDTSYSSSINIFSCCLYTCAHFFQSSSRNRTSASVNSYGVSIWARFRWPWMDESEAMVSISLNQQH